MGLKIRWTKFALHKITIFNLKSIAPVAHCGNFSGFFCHSNSTWNWFWRIYLENIILPFLNFRDSESFLFDNFILQKVQNPPKKSKSEPPNKSILFIGLLWFHVKSERQNILSRNSDNFLKMISFFYFSSEKPNNNHYLPTGQSRRGNKLKRRKAYYNRQRKDIAVSFCPFR